MRFSYLERIIWLTMACLILWAVTSGTIEASNTGILVLGLALSLFCARVFIGHGGKVVTPLGIWMVMTVLVASYASVVGMDDYRVSDSSIMLAQALTLMQAVGISVFSWGSNEGQVSTLGGWNSSRRVVIVFCWVLLAIAFLMGRGGWCCASNCRKHRLCINSRNGAGAVFERGN